MRYIWTAALLFLFNFTSMAQYTSDFEAIESENGEEAIYKGFCTFEDLKNISAFHLDEAADKYQPSDAAMEALRAKIQDYKIVVFLGTWCEDSHNLIPKLYRVLRESNLNFEESLTIHGLDRAKKGRDEVEQKYNITNVPTIIVLQDDEEKGRITETVQKTVEQDLLNIIEKK